MLNKKGAELIIPNIIFILLNLVLFLALLFFIARAGSGAGFEEQRYAKKIALLIDEAKPGTEIELDVSEVIEKFEGESKVPYIFKIDKEENKVIVKLREGKGYEFSYFSGVDVELEYKKEGEKYSLILKAK